MTAPMGRGFERWDQLVAWLHANDEALLIGAIVAAALVALMLVLRSIGARITAADPDCRTWKSVIARVLAKTSVAFMIVAALEVVLLYVDPPSRLNRIVDVLFIIAFALQGAVCAGVGPRRDQPSSQRRGGRDDTRERNRDHPSAGQRRCVRNRNHRHSR
jgi:hypothetical protein